MTTALIIIDVQKGLFAFPDYPPHDGEAIVARIAGLLAKARAAKTPVYFVQHDGVPQDPLHHTKPGFAFVDQLTPQPNEDVTVKRRGSAFPGTDLDAKLRRAGIDHVIVTGMESQNCVDSFVRGAFERDYKVTLVSDAHTTCGSPVLKSADVIAHENATLGDNGAILKRAEDFKF